MIHLISELNWIGVAVAFFAYFFVGALWFTALFSKPYKLSLGRENEPEQKPAPIFIIGPAICTFFVTLTTAILMHALDFDSYADAFEFGIVIGIGYLVANTVNIAINPNMPRPLFYSLISGTYHLTGILMACLILQWFRI